METIRLFYDQAHKPYPFQTNLGDGRIINYLTKVEELLLTFDVRVGLIGTGTSGAVIASWLNGRGKLNFEYVHIKKHNEDTHRQALEYSTRIFNNVPKRWFIVDDHVSSGETVLRLVNQIKNWNCSYNWLPEEGIELIAERDIQFSNILDKLKNTGFITRWYH